MRAQAHTNGVRVHAVAGTHAVLLGFDLDDIADADVLGFGIRRTDHTEDERYWLRGMKVFPSVVPHPAPGQSFSTRRQPVQGFQWGDYSVKPEHRYTYRVAALTGPVANPRIAAYADVEVTTEAEDDGLHGVWFNRGVAGSQAWDSKFGPPSVELDDPQSAAWAWLSRGLGEAFQRVCATATDATWALRGAFYEFTWKAGLDALAAAKDRGADVALVVHGRDRDPADSPEDGDTTTAQSRAAATATGLDPVITWRVAPNTSALQHNKFLVLLKDGAPVAVWTGSTNLTQGAIFGHSNVGHLIHDPAIAASFLAYWEQLRSDAGTAALRTWNEGATPVADPLPAVVLSPRATKSDLLVRYADRLDAGSSSIHLTGAFGLNAVFRERLAVPRDIPRTVLLDAKPPAASAVPSTDPNVRVVWGAHLQSQLEQWAAEQLTGFNTHVRYIHLKVLLVDPLTDAPVVFTGSANYSNNSTTLNEENTVILQETAGSPALSADAVRRVADIYLTEYHRLFMHHVFRDFATTDVVSRGLSENASWLVRYRTGWRATQRRLFSGQPVP